MPVATQLRIKYSDLFDDNPLPFADYFIGASKENLFASIPLLVNLASPGGEKSAAELVNEWFSLANQTIKQNILGKLNQGNSIASIISSLKLAEYITDNQFATTQTISDAEFELNLFKAYLVLNEEQDDLESTNLPKLPQGGGDESFMAWMLMYSYHNYDLSNYQIWDIIAPQVVKSITFFQYLNNRPKLQPHLAYFLNMFGVADWQAWVKQYLAVVFPALQSKNISYFDFNVTQDADYNSNCHFLDNLCVGANTHRLSDFITLRSFPLMKIFAGRYRVINKLFLMEKMFKSLQFLFSININNALPAQQQLADFRADHCDKFSEQTILYDVLKKSFPKKWTHISGEGFKEKGYSAEPDYYIRFKNKLFLFESKDVVLTGAEKQSRDYPILKKALKKKFYKIEHNGNIQKKAILQIIGNIKRILDHYYTQCDIGYNGDAIKIYPILVTHDRQFDSPGVNKLLLHWFNEELDNIKGTHNISNIKPLTVVNIDTFILHQEAFKSRGKVRFEDLIVAYHEAMSIIQPKKAGSQLKAVQRAHLSFNHFVESYFDKYKLRKKPTFLREYFEELF